MKVGVIVGSLRADSINRRLSRALMRLSPTAWTFEQVDIHDLPLYNQDNDGAPPAQAVRLKQHVESMDALMFVTPEYNRSIPGVLKNALDTASRPYGKNSFAGKPAGVIGASIGSIGTALAQQHLRNVLAYLDVPTLGQPEAFIHLTEGKIDAAGEVSDDKLRGVLQGWVDAYRQFVEAHVGQAR
jgi:chromate reductase, NAD(P)H dehydrogenase (quinone)